MNFQFKSRNLEGLTEVEEYANKKNERLTHLIPETAFVELELKQFPKAINGGDKEAEIMVDIPGRKPVFRFAAQSDNFFEAIDRVFDKLDEELSRDRDKLKDHSLHHQRPPKEVLADMVNQEEL